MRLLAIAAAALGVAVSAHAAAPRFPKHFKGDPLALIGTPSAVAYQTINGHRYVCAEWMFSKQTGGVVGLIYNECFLVSGAA